MIKWNSGANDGGTKTSQTLPVREMDDDRLEYWSKRWRNKDIGFYKTGVNDFLSNYIENSLSAKTIWRFSYPCVERQLIRNGKYLHIILKKPDVKSHRSFKPDQVDQVINLAIQSYLFI